MQRRSFLKFIALGSLYPALPAIGATQIPDTSPNHLPDTSTGSNLNEPKPTEDYLRKMRNPNSFYEGDVTSDSSQKRLVCSLARRLGQVKITVGHGNFSVLSFDDMLVYARRYSQIGEFTREETDFLEKIFYEDAMQYGFYGEKPLTNMTDSINQRSIKKVPYSGQFLFKGGPLELYTKIKRDIGDTLVLTSGVRSVVKQMDLFIRKASKFDGNLSLASRSLAPPGYSFHGIGDFDVGHVDLGTQNFTDAFAETDEFKKLIDLGYIKIRYPKGNTLGVRFEPWHIKVV